MPSLLQRGNALLNRTMAASTSEKVRVIRGSSVLCDEWLATPGTTGIETVSEGQVIVVGDRRDWLGDPLEWRYEGVTVKPARGDLIEWAREGFTLVFEVLPADGEDVWRPSGTFEDRMRVHTKLIENRQEPAPS